MTLEKYQELIDETEKRVKNYIETAEVMLNLIELKDAIRLGFQEFLRAQQDSLLFKKISKPAKQLGFPWSFFGQIVKIPSFSELLLGIRTDIQNSNTTSKFLKDVLEKTTMDNLDENFDALNLIVKTIQDPGQYSEKLIERTNKFFFKTDLHIYRGILTFLFLSIEIIKIDLIENNEIAPKLKLSVKKVWNRYKEIYFELKLLRNAVVHAKAYEKKLCKVSRKINVKWGSFRIIKHLKINKQTKLSDYLKKYPINKFKALIKDYKQENSQLLTGLKNSRNEI
jgi:hypothetical protein